MSEPSLGAVDPTKPDLPPESPSPSAAESLAAGGGAGLSIGQRWRNYSITAVASGLRGAHFVACEVGTMEEVLIRVRPVAAVPAGRLQAWPVLAALPESGFLRSIEAVEENGLRYEVTARTSEPTLREWMACHQVGLPAFECIVTQLGKQIETLHEAGLVHLDLRPDTIFVSESENEFQVVVGGLGEAMVYEQAGLVPIEVDPYYAPPEAAGLFQHSAGAGLCAWDWWGLGRIAQELAHGRHAYSLLFEREVSTRPPELRARAEAALLDRDPSGVRAGAVELLGAGANGRVRTLLRGLLTSSRDGRWQGPQLAAWMRNEAAADRYDLPREARLFVWRRQAFTLPEAADLFAQPDYFAFGQAQLFPEPGERDTLIEFLAAVPSCRAEHERVRKLLDLVEAAAWQQAPLILRRAAVTGLVWLTLADKGRRRPLHLGPHRIDAAGLQEMLASAPPAEAVALIGVLTQPAYLGLVEPLDPAAGRALQLLAGLGAEALAFAQERAWLAPDDAAARTRLLRLVLAPERDLLARRERLRAAYATSTDGALATLLSQDKPLLLGLVLLAFAGEQPGAFGFVTHEDWNQQRHAKLRAEIEQVSLVLSWRRLERVMNLAPALLGYWSVGLPIWLIPIALALSARAWGWALGIAVFAVAGRWAARFAVRRHLSRLAPGAKPWTWRDHPERCRREAIAANGGADVPGLLQLGRRRAELMAALAGIPMRQPGPAPAAPSRLVGLWLGALGGAVVPLGFCALMLSGLLAREAELQPFAPSRRSLGLPAKPAVPDLIEVAGADGKMELYEPAEDGFGNRRRGPLKRWDVPRPARPAPLAILRQQPVTTRQMAHAVVCAELLLSPYPRKGLEVVLAVSVPTAEREPAVVLYDSVRGMLVERRAFILPAEPQKDTWYEVAGRAVVYLGRPPEFSADISLAPSAGMLANEEHHDRSRDLFSHRKH